MIGVYKITADGKKLLYTTDDPIQAREYLQALKELNPKDHYTKRIIGRNR